MKLLIHVEANYPNGNAASPIFFRTDSVESAKRKAASLLKERGLVFRSASYEDTGFLGMFFDPVYFDLD